MLVFKYLLLDGALCMLCIILAKVKKLFLILMFKYNQDFLNLLCACFCFLVDCSDLVTVLSMKQVKGIGNRKR